MTTYICDRCGFSTKYKHRLKTHLERKNTCLPKKDDIVVIKQHNLPISSGLITIPFKEDINTDGLGCKYCRKIFSSTGNLNKHYKICKKKKKFDYETMLEIENDILKKKILDLETKNTITSNTQINIGNIIINNYGKEDISYIKENDLTKYVKNMPPGVIQLIEKIHFNPKHPENSNLRITNKKEHYIQVRRKNKWLLEDKCETINNLLIDKYQLLEEHLSQLDKNTLTHTDKRIIERFRNNYEGNVTYVKNLLKKVELLILNNSK